MVTLFSQDTSRYSKRNHCWYLVHTQCKNLAAKTFSTCCFYTWERQRWIEWATYFLDPIFASVSKNEIVSKAKGGSYFLQRPSFATDSLGLILEERLFRFFLPTFLRKAICWGAPCWLGWHLHEPVGLKRSLGPLRLAPVQSGLCRPIKNSFLFSESFFGSFGNKIWTNVGKRKRKNNTIHHNPSEFLCRFPRWI